MCYECCYSNSHICCFYIYNLFCGLPTYIIGITFNLALFVAVLIDPFITLGTFCNFILPSSKSLLSCYRSILVNCSKTASVGL